MKSTRIPMQGRMCILDYVLGTEVGNRISISISFPYQSMATCVYFKKKYLNVIQFGT